MLNHEAVNTLRAMIRIADLQARKVRENRAMPRTIPRASPRHGEDWGFAHIGVIA